MNGLASMYKVLKFLFAIWFHCYLSFFSYGNANTGYLDRVRGRLAKLGITVPQL